MPEHETEKNAAIRLVKFIALCGAASRRGAGELVKAGRITVNGHTCNDPSLPVSESDRVALDGRPLAPAAEKYYIMLNKPRGYASTNADPFADKKAIDLIRLPDPSIRLFSAGRLDKDSEGLLIFSNDGDYTARLTHPSHGTIKRYRVETASPLTDSARRSMMRGILDEGEKLRCLSVEDAGEPNCYYFTLGEGRKREIRRLVSAAGSRVEKLCRISCGKLQLGDLACGQWRRLSPDEAESAAVNPCI